MGCYLPRLGDDNIVKWGVAAAEARKTDLEDHCLCVGELVYGLASERLLSLVTAILSFGSRAGGYFSATEQRCG